MTKTALICGISGQDGAYLSHLLLDKGYRVVGTSRDARMSRFSNLRKLDLARSVECYSMSPTDFRSVLYTVDKVQPDEIYNFSGQSSLGVSFQMPVETLESHTLSIMNLLEVVRFLKRPARLFNAASGECYGGIRGGALDETDPFHPRSPYAVAKAAAFWQVSTYREAYKLYACSGILFNHESHLRGLNFVTRKITDGVARIHLGGQQQLTLGNIHARRDWGHAEDYVKAMWLMLQQPQPEDYIIASGSTETVRSFTEKAFAAIGLRLCWQGSGVKETGIDQHGVTRVSIDPKYFRLVEVEVLHGNPAKAERELGWRRQHTLASITAEMVAADINALQQQ
ncbi:MAG TPA: GDP-mannose 4,6-dehydratase [Gammaproteobacteria bacterium]|nr:GDP-mannose 4,6-dehydratase [Gammaproteobacteria bacterium]